MLNYIKTLCSKQKQPNQFLLKIELFLVLYDKWLFLTKSNANFQAYINTFATDVR